MFKLTLELGLFCKIYVADANVNLHLQYSTTITCKL